MLSMNENSSSSPASTQAETPVPPPSLPENQSSTDVALSLSGSDRRFLAASAAVILVLMGVYLVRARLDRPTDVAIVRSPENELALRVDINTATWIEWMQMEGIGETMARNIVADRETHGPFRSIDDVSRVRGIGDAILTRIRPRLQCRDCEAEPSAGSEGGLNTKTPRRREGHQDFR